VCIYKLPFGHALDPEGAKNSDETHVLVHLQPIKQRPGTKHACEQESPHGPFPYEEDRGLMARHAARKQNKDYRVLQYSSKQD
jgi:hypothetical protein